MAVNINRYDSTQLTTLVDGSVNDSVTNIKLVGKGISNYSEFIAENLVWMVENFANASEPTKPLLGQLWWDKTDSQLKVLVDESPVTWEVIGTTSDETLPAGTLPTQPRPAGELFWNAGDGIDGSGLEWVSDGAAWRSFAPLWQSSEPDTDNTHSFGSVSKSWANIYSTLFTGDLVGDVTGNVTGDVTGDLTGNLIGEVTLTVSNNISAAGTTQGAATALTSSVNRVTTVVAASAEGVKLPTAVAGKEVRIINSDAADTLKIFPNTSDKINDQAVNLSIDLASGARLTLVAVDATNWYAFYGVYG